MTDSSMLAIAAVASVMLIVFAVTGVVGTFGLAFQKKWGVHVLAVINTIILIVAAVAVVVIPSYGLPLLLTSLGMMFVLYEYYYRYDKLTDRQSVVHAAAYATAAIAIVLIVSVVSSVSTTHVNDSVYSALDVYLVITSIISLIDVVSYSLILRDHRSGWAIYASTRVISEIFSLGAQTESPIRVILSIGLTSVIVSIAITRLNSGRRLNEHAVSQHPVIVQNDMSGI